MKTNLTYLLTALLLIASNYNCPAVDDIKVTKVQTIFLEGIDDMSSFGNNVKINNKYMAVSEQFWTSDLGNGDKLRGVGRVHIYKLGSDNTWKRSQILEPDSLNRKNLFGKTVYFEDDILVVSATYEDKTSKNSPVVVRFGAIYLYKLDEIENIWVRTQKIQPNSTTLPSEFGYTIAMHGEDLYIGAPRSWYYYEDHQIKDHKKGNIFRYRFNSESGKFEFHDKLSMPEDERPLVLGDKMVIDDNKLIISDNLSSIIDDNVEKAKYVGRVDYYKYSTDEDKFVHHETVLPINKYSYQFLGISLYFDEDRLYVFKHRGKLDNNQVSILDRRDDINIYKFRDNDSLELKQIIKPISKGSVDYTLGSMAISGNIMAIEGMVDMLDENGENAIPFAGSVHLYTREREDENWEYSRKIVREERKLDNRFGYGLDIHGNTLVVSSEKDTLIDKETGQAKIGGMLHIYEIDTTTTSVSTQENQPTSPPITISPNPTCDVTTIGIPAVGEVRVYLTDITGSHLREIWSGTADVPTSVMMDATGLATGEYFVVVETAEGVISEKIVVER